MNIVAKEEYWSIILNDPTQDGLITTEDAAFNRRINDIKLVLTNTFINSLDENLISKWEETLYLNSDESKSLIERKAEILYTLCEKNYVPMSIIKRFLLNLIGDDNKFAVDFIKDENKLVIHTDRIEEEKLPVIQEVVGHIVSDLIEVQQYNHNMEISWRDINKYSECETIDDLLAVNPDYKNDLTSDGEWCYPLSSLSVASYGFQDSPVKKLINFTLPSITNNDCYRLWNKCKMDILDVSFPNDESQYGNSTCIGCSARSMRIQIPKAKGFSYSLGDCVELESLELFAPQLTTIASLTTNSRKLKNVILYAPKVSVASMAFSNTILTKTSTVAVLDSLPTWTDGEEHMMTIGIHVDHQNDEEVLAAIGNAEAKGWTLTVQWNGTSTAQASATYSLRKPPIFARVSEMEHPDGTTERILDWGHYVTDPENYEEFPSLEAAYDYFNLEQPNEN